MAPGRKDVEVVKLEEEVDDGLERLVRQELVNSKIFYNMITYPTKDYSNPSSNLKRTGTPASRKNQPHHQKRKISCRSTHLPPFQTLIDAQLDSSEKEENHNGMDKVLRRKKNIVKLHKIVFFSFHSFQNRTGRHDAGLKRYDNGLSSPGPPRI